MLTICLFWEICMRIGVMPRDKQMPILLIIAGVILPILHQASLGTIYLMVPHELHALWYSPLLPVLFLASAIMVGPAIVILESLTSHKLMKDKINMDLLVSLSKFIPYLLGAYLLIMLCGMVTQGTIHEAFKITNQSLSWWVEIVIGIILPIILFMSPNYTKTKKGLFTACSLVAGGVVWNRINVSMIGIQADTLDVYCPAWTEFFITAGVLSAGALTFRWAKNNLEV